MFINQYFKNLLISGNISTLLLELRCEQDPTHRLQAAQVLSEMRDSSIIPWLLEAAVNEPDAEVKREVMAILRDWIGADLDLALQVEASGAERADPWLVDVHADIQEQETDGELWMDQGEDFEDEVEDDEEQEDEDQQSGEPDFADFSEDSLTFEEHEEIRGLIMVAAGEGNPELRRRAVRALGKYTTLNVVEVLAALAAGDDQPVVRQAARQTLQNRFGDNLTRILAGMGVEVDLLEQTEAEEESENGVNPPSIFSSNSPINSPGTGARIQHSPVVQEEKAVSPLWLIPLVVIGIIVILYFSGVLTF
jgi:hypothetical protein